MKSWYGQSKDIEGFFNQYCDKGQSIYIWLTCRFIDFISCWLRCV